MITVLIITHILICVGLSIVVLLQAGKGGGLSGAFGGAGAQTVLGKRGAATFLSRLTRWMAIGFMVVSLGLAFLYSQRSGPTTVPAATDTEEVVDGETPTTEGAAAPAVPGGTTMPGLTDEE